MKISAYGIAMGVKQRRYPYEACLRSLCDFCDEVIVAYDKRFDNPIIFSRIDPKIRTIEIEYHFEQWDFINIALTQARRACNGEWCYIYGMDEVFQKNQTQNIRNAVERALPSWDVITLRMVCMIWFDHINMQYFDMGHKRGGMTRNKPNLRHGTSDLHIGVMDSEWWDGKYIKSGDDFMYFDELTNKSYFGEEEIHLIEAEDDYGFPDDIANNPAEIIKYRLKNYTHIWHYAWYHIGRKEQQGGQTQIWQDRTYGRSPNLDIPTQIQKLKETIILDPERTKELFALNMKDPTWIQIDLDHSEYVQEWLGEMTLDAI